MISTNGLTYIGSSCEPMLANRLAGHRSNYKRYLNDKGNYVTSFRLFENDSKVNIYLIERFPCDSREDVHAREGYHIQQFDCVNKIVPGRTLQESKKVYYESNKEEIQFKKKEYYHDNKEKLHKKYKCICGCNYSKNNKTHHLKTHKHQSFQQLIDCTRTTDISLFNSIQKHMKLLK